MDWSYYNPVKVYLLDFAGFVAHLKCLCTGKRLAFIASERSIRQYGLDGAIAALQAANDVVLITDTPSNPTFESVHSTIGRFTAKPDRIVAIGGGSVIDTAKAISAMAAYDWPIAIDRLYDGIHTKSYQQLGTGIPILAVPTTAGTGAEMTMWGTVWDMVHSQKYSVEAPWLYPEDAWVVPELTVSMSQRLTLSTGLDALSHAVEAYWSTRSNPVVRALARDAVSLIAANLRGALDNPESLPHREGMMRGALFAGLAFSNTRTTACHGLSYPMTIRWGIEHGFAVAMTLPEVLLLNWPAVAEGDSLLVAWGLSSPQDARPWLDSLCNGIQTLRLGAFGVSDADAMPLADASLVKERMGNNPVALTAEDIRGILKRIL